MRKDVKELRTVIRQLFYERRMQGKYPNDMNLEDLTMIERDKLKRKAKSLIANGISA